MGAVRNGVLIAAALSAIALVGCGGSAFELALDSGSGDRGGGDGGGANDAGNRGDDSGNTNEAGGGMADAGGADDADGLDADGGSSSDANDVDSAGVGCPASPPAAGSACPEIGFVCEYGTNANPMCNQVVQCSSSGWVHQGSTGCPSGYCPSSYNSVPRGGSCQPRGLACDYSQGTCTCSSSAGGPVRLDGGYGPQWRCFAPAPGCPSPRPEMGSPCAHPGASCDYAACYGGVALQCKNGTWQPMPVACPVLAGSTGP
jgi:hypothetical protein